MSINKQSSEVAFSHNQREADFDPKSGVVLGPGNPQYKKYLNLKETERIDKSVGEPAKIEAPIKNLFTTIDNIKLEKDFKNNLNQRRLLSQKKEKAKELINDVLRQASEYRNIIKQLKKVSKKRLLATKNIPTILPPNPLLCVIITPKAFKKVRRS